MKVVTPLHQFLSTPVSDELEAWTRHSKDAVVHQNVAYVNKTHDQQRALQYAKWQLIGMS